MNFFFPAGVKVTEEEAEQLERSIEQNPEGTAADIFDNQNVAMLGVSLLAQAGVVSSFAAMSGIQKVQHAYHKLKDQVKPRAEVVPSSPMRVEQDPGMEYQGNIIVTKHGLESNEWKLKLLSAASSSIEISGNYCGGKIFRRALEIIATRLELCESLVVHILSSPELLESRDITRAEEIQKAFPFRFHFLQTKTICSNIIMSGDNAEELHSRENHLKLVLVDGRYFVLGGTNFEQHLGSKGTEHQSIGITSSMYERFVLTASRDMDIVGSGEITKFLRKTFFAFFAFWANEMGISYQGTSLNTNNHSKKALQEENECLKEKVQQLEERNKSLCDKLEQIRFSVKNGLDLPELFPGDSEDLKDWELLDHPDWETTEVDVANEIPLAYIDEMESGKCPRLIKNVPMKACFGSQILASPHTKYASPCTEEYIQAIDRAEHKIRLAHLNVNPSESLMESILRAVVRGVSLEVITTAADNSTTLASHFYAWANRINYLAFMTGEPHFEKETDVDIKDSVSIYEYGVSRTTYHKKILLVDDTTVIFGSYNMSQKSHNSDDEVILSLRSRDVCAHVNQILDEDVTRSNLISPKQAMRYYFSWRSKFLADLQSGRVAKLIG